MQGGNNDRNIEYCACHKDHVRGDQHFPKACVFMSVKIFTAIHYFNDNVNISVGYVSFCLT